LCRVILFSFDFSNNFGKRFNIRTECGDFFENGFNGHFICYIEDVSLSHFLNTKIVLKITNIIIDKNNSLNVLSNGTGIVYLPKEYGSRDLEPKH